MVGWGPLLRSNGMVGVSLLVVGWGPPLQGNSTVVVSVFVVGWAPSLPRNRTVVVSVFVVGWGPPLQGNSVCGWVGTLFTQKPYSGDECLWMGGVHFYTATVQSG